MEDKELTGQPDGFVASGKRSPKLPFFCLRKFKKDNVSSGDLARQVLAAILAAQVQNKAVLTERAVPIYGCYVVGRFWYFVVLMGREYAIS